AYVTQGITEPTQSNRSTRQSSAGRKALATMGRRGGKQAAKRWKDPNQKEYQEAARAPLEKANRQRSYSTDENKARIQLLVSRDRKSTRLNSSHVSISYAVFCLKKKR